MLQYFLRLLPGASLSEGRQRKRRRRTKVDEEKVEEKNLEEDEEVEEEEEATTQSSEVIKNIIMVAVLEQHTDFNQFLQLEKRAILASRVASVILISFSTSDSH